MKLTFKKIFSAEIKGMSFEQVYQFFPELFTESKAKLKKIFVENPAAGEGIAGSVHLMAVTGSGIVSAMTGNFAHGLSVTAIGGGALLCDYLKATHEQKIPKRYEDKVLKLTGVVLYNLGVASLSKFFQGSDLRDTMYFHDNHEQISFQSDLNQGMKLLDIVGKKYVVDIELDKILNMAQVRDANSMKETIDLFEKGLSVAGIKEKVVELNELVKGVSKKPLNKEGGGYIDVLSLKLQGLLLGLKYIESCKEVYAKLDENSLSKLAEVFIDSGSLHPYISDSSGRGMRGDFEKYNSYLSEQPVFMKEEMDKFITAYVQDSHLVTSRFWSFQRSKLQNLNPLFRELEESSEKSGGVCAYVDRFVQEMDRLNEYERTPNPVLRQIRKAGNYKDFPYEFTGAMFTGFSVGSMIVASIFEKDPAAREAALAGFSYLGAAGLSFWMLPVETNWGSKAVERIKECGVKISDVADSIKLRVFKPKAQIVATEGELGKTISEIANGKVIADEVYADKSKLLADLNNTLRNIKVNFAEKLNSFKEGVVDKGINFAAKMIVTVGNTPKTTAYIPAFVSCYYRSMEVINQVGYVSEKEIVVKSLGVFCATLSNVLGTMAVIKLADKQTYNSIVKFVTGIDLANSKGR